MPLKLLKGMNIVMMSLFLLSAAVQYNDPDPFQWIVLYGLAALACLLFLIKQLQWWLAVGVAALALAWAGFIVPALAEATDEISIEAIFGDAGMKTIGVELARELGGLMIVLCWMAILTIAAFRQKR